MTTAPSATCERTGKRTPLAEGFFVANPSSGEWSFVSKDAPERGADYNVAVASIIRSPEAFIDWMAHLNEKTWFDARKFMDFFTRLREKSRLYGGL